MTYPKVFKVHATAASGIQANWTTTSREGDIHAAIPPEFGGLGGGQSPEDFFALAILNCYVATFKVIAEKSNLGFESLTTEGALEVDLNENKFPWMARMHLNVTLHRPSDSDKASRLLEKAIKQCLVHNSVKTQVTFDFKMT